ncbi:Methyltransferase, domain of unknown function DUF2260 [Penicillium occitanis (nom. inval.)]|nr:Methyltransferase, domain of unknown function DUF2260 [Penicillium occitanis (nom. inval.)]PCH02250.1 hypothetical protein PENOC_044590 [Penicillium occitanis (nom. inval.)]
MFENILPIQLTHQAQRRLRDATSIAQTSTTAANSTIIDIRPHPEQTENTLRQSIQESLNKITSDQWSEAGVDMPSLLLWDEQGLRYFEDVTYSPSYYLTNEEIGLLEKNKYKIAERIEPGSMLVELGSGNLRKIKILLEALDELGRDVDYFALDVSLPELQRTLALVPPGHFNHVRCFGLLGTYDDGREWLNKPEIQSRPKTLLSLGSTLGSFQRHEVADFLKSFCTPDNAAGRSPSYLIGFDGCKDANRVFKAYNDPEGANQRFVKNGLCRANQILGYDAFDLNHWHVKGIWEAENGRHSQYYYPDTDLSLGDRDGMQFVPAGKSILAIQSHKYDVKDQNELTEKAGLDIVDSWSSGQGYSPAGLMAACWASQYNMITRIIDQKPGRTRTGHADGLHSRTLEIMDSFGLVDHILRQAVVESEMCYWACVDDEFGNIKRVKRTSSQPENLSRFGQVLLNQGLIEDILIQHINEIGRVNVEWQKRAEMLDLSSNFSDYPVTVKVKDLANSNQETEIIHARYIVACDGSHGWTREQLHVRMETHSEESTWGVIDIAPITNFPDVRQSCAIRSEINGSIMTAPRENRLLRLYIQLKGNDELEKVARQGSEESPKALVKIAERAMKPYYLRYKYCDWWSIYSISQRLVKHHRIHDRIFLAGDAAHTHSPMAGQGMNISMQDTYNLIWKLGSVITHNANPAILETYESERRPVARTLMKLDKRVLSAYEQKDPTGEGVDKVREQYAGFMSGTGVVYEPSILVADHDTKFRLSRAGMEDVKVGMRLTCFNKKIKNQADGSMKHLLSLLRSTGVWRLLVFAGNLRQEAQLKKLNEFATSSLAENHLHKLSSFVESFLIHASPRDSIDFFDIPEMFRPFDETFGWDYGRIFSDFEDPEDNSLSNGVIGAGNHEPGNDIMEFVILCRPDQHVAWIGGLDDLEELKRMFARIFNM